LSKLENVNKIPPHHAGARTKQANDACSRRCGAVGCVFPAGTSPFGSSRRRLQVRTTVLEPVVLLEDPILTDGYLGNNKYLNVEIGLVCVRMPVLNGTCGPTSTKCPINYSLAVNLERFPSTSELPRNFSSERSFFSRARGYPAINLFNGRRNFSKPVSRIQTNLDRSFSLLRRNEMTVSN
jgi:hypothetical protein